MNHWLLLLVLTLSACSTLQPFSKKPVAASEHASAPISNRELDVMEALLRDSFAHVIKKGGTLILHENTTTDNWLVPDLNEDSQGIESKSIALDRELMHALKKINASPVHLPPALKKRLPIQYLSREESKTIWGNTNEDGWKRFHQRFPNSGSCISISRVAFSSDGSTALVYLGKTSGWLAGTGHTCVLRHTFWGWKVDRTGLVWVS